MSPTIFKKNAVVVDVDGTIALRGDRDPYAHEWAMEDAVNWPVVNAVNALASAYGWEIIVVSARHEKFRKITEYWSWQHGVFIDKPLYMREDFDNRPDQDVKREIYERYIKPHYFVQVVFDDRDKVVKMWRELGLSCFQVAEGNY